MPHNKLNSRLVLFITPQHDPCRKYIPQQFYCCVTWLSFGQHRESSSVTVYGHYLSTAVTESLLINGSTCYKASSLKLFISNSLRVYCHFFFFVGFACNVCDRPCLPSLWLGSHSDYPANSPSGSLIRCQPVQVYYHHPQPRVPLDPVYHIYPGDYLVWAFLRGLKLGLFSMHAG
jgi:hypothetical protein